MALLAKNIIVFHKPAECRLETSETSIAITFLIVNLSTLLRQILLSLFVKNQENHFSEDSALLILMLFEDSQQYNLSLKPPNFPLAS